MIEDTTKDIKNLADAEEQLAIRKQKAAERAIKAASDARSAARKAAVNRERTRLKLGDNASYNKMLEDTIKGLAEAEEQLAICRQKAAERAIKTASDAKNCSRNDK